MCRLQVYVALLDGTVIALNSVPQYTHEVPVWVSPKGSAVFSSPAVVAHVLIVGECSLHAKFADRLKGSAIQVSW